MKCPNCGYDAPHISVDNGKRYRHAVEKRLVEYGYTEHMTPEKHQAATAIRKVISIRYGVKCKAGGGMLAEDADRAIEGLDEVLPPKGEKP
jgi:hypothetical protein